MRAIVLLSGGIDSAVVMALALREQREVTALSVDYGQAHAYELECARVLAELAGVSHKVVSVDLRSIGASALTSDRVSLERGRKTSDMTSVPRSYVPGRNTVMLGLAFAWAEALQASEIHIGANAQDITGYPDCRPAYLAAFERVAQLALARPRDFALCVPLMRLRKAQVIEAGAGLGVDFARTSTCYEPMPAGACGQCDACVIRLEAFAANGMTDPIAYREEKP